MSDDYGLLHPAAEQNHSSEIPDAFYNNVGKLPERLKAKLSLHDLRCIYEFMVRPVIWTVIINMSTDNTRHHAAEASGADKPLLPRLREVREAMKGTLCDPDGRVCIIGSAGDNAVLQEALAKLNEIIKEMEKV